MHLNLIVAYDRNRGIGRDNQLLWHLADDMSFFKKMTTNQVVIMGRKTYESLPERFRPLPNRINIVITRSDIQSIYSDLIYVHTADEAIRRAVEYQDKDVFVIGGGQIYKEMLPFVQTIYATEVEALLDADTFFASLDATWTSELISLHHRNDKNDFDFKIIKYSRKCLVSSNDSSQSQIL